MSSNPSDIPQWLNPEVVPSSTTTQSEEEIAQQQQLPAFAYNQQLFPSFGTNPEQGAMHAGQQHQYIGEFDDEQFQSEVEPSSGPLRARKSSREPQRQSGGSQSSSGRTSPIDSKKNLTEKKRRGNIRLGIETLRHKLPDKYSKDANSDPVLLERVAEYIEELEKKIGSGPTSESNVADSSAPQAGRSEPGPSSSK